MNGNGLGGRFGVSVSLKTEISVNVNTNREKKNVKGAEGTLQISFYTFVQAILSPTDFCITAMRVVIY